MKNLNKYLIISLTIIFVSSLSISAQPDEAQREKFKEERVKYFNEKLDLTASQAEKFWPVYHDFHNRMMKINEDEKSLMTYYTSNSEAMSDNEIDETLEKYLSLQEDRHVLSGEYHQSYIEILGKKKTMELYTLERRFRMHILEGFRKGRGHGQESGGRGYGRGSR